MGKLGNQAPEGETEEGQWGVRTWATEQSRKQTDGDPRLNLV